MSGHNTYTNEFLNSKRLLGDQPADAFIAQAFKDAGLKKDLQLWLSGTAGYSRLTEQFPGVAFINEANCLPAWASPRLMKTGAAFFARHAETIMTLLGLLSLPYCYTAANGAMVLYLSERMRNETSKRLHETAVFVWEIMAPGAFAGEGNGFTEILKVRLMHAAVRYYTLQSGKWDDAWGFPINQEDMAGTNLSFSLIVIRGLRLMGFTVSEADQEAYIHLWNVIGYLSGLQENLIPMTSKMAQLLDHTINARQFCVSEHGRQLTQTLTTHIVSVNEGKATANEILGLMRYLLGADVADMLGIDARVLPAYKLTLLRTINLFKGFKPEKDPQTAYMRAYSEFKKQKIA